MPNETNFIKLLGLAMLGYILLILGHGYVFGHLGTMETFPYLKKLTDPTLYPNDFYIDGIQSQFPDVRWIFVQVLRILGIHGAWTAFLAHIVVSVFLIIGMMKIVLLFSKNLTTAFLATMMTLLILYNHNLGGNELYYNSLAPSLLAKSIGIWSIYFLLQKRISIAIILLIPTTFIHPMVGIQLFIIGIIITFGMALDSKKESNKPFPWLLVGLYLVTAGAWIAFLQRSFSDSSVASAKIFKILNFRLGHHYFPSEYPIKEIFLLVPFFILGWWFFIKRNKTLFWFYSISILGLIVYTLGVEFAQISAILSAQWFKTTIWLKFFSSIALFVIIEEKLLSKVTFLRKLYSPTTAIVFIGLAIFLLVKLPQRQPTTLDLPWRGAYNDRIKIALLAKKLTPKDALFITPTDFTHLKYYGERSTYVDYKATIHFRSKLVEWYDRIGDIYSTPFTAPNSSNQLMPGAFYISSDTAHLKSLGITHVIAKTNRFEDSKHIGQVGDYLIIEL